MKIKELAKEAGFNFEHIYWTERDLAPLVIRFAELVAAHEREECADFAERRVLATENNDQKIGYYHACRTIAAGIRARGKA